MASLVLFLSSYSFLLIPWPHAHVPDAQAVSIFVNPAQFAPHEDFDTYPRQMDADLRALADTGISVSVFAPTAKEMYSQVHLPTHA